MAVVRITDSLIDSCLSAARNTFSSRISAAEAAFPVGFADHMYDSTFGPYQASMQTLPHWFFTARTSIEVPKVMTPTADIGLLGDHEMQLTTPRMFPVNGKIPPNANGAKLRSLNQYSSAGEFCYYADPWDKKDEEIINACTERNVKIQQLRLDCRDFAESVKQLLKGHTTLAPALKQWPALWDLLPSEFKNRHMQIKERKERQETVKVNVDQMTVTMALAKLTGG